MEHNPYQSPRSNVDLENHSEGLSDQTVYVGFWLRVGATIVDNVLLALVSFPLLYSIYGFGYFNSDQLAHGVWDVIVSYVLPIVAILGFWFYYAATPGKMVVDAIIVDAKTGGRPALWQFIVRYLGYIVSTLLLFIGFLWVAFDKRKQGLHDKMAGTVVIKKSA